MHWEVDRVSIESEEVFEFIKKELPCPLGFIIFGADSGIKAKVYELFRRKVGKPLAFDRRNVSGRYIGEVKKFLKKGQPVIVCMHGDDSLVYGFRQQTIAQLRELGACLVTGVYVKASRRDNINFEAITREPSFSYQSYYKQIEKLEQDPPSNRDFDYYIVISSDESAA